MEMKIKFYFAEIKAYVDSTLNTTVAGGIKIHGLHTTIAPRKQQARSGTVPETYQHVPYDQGRPGNNSNDTNMSHAYTGDSMTVKDSLKAYLDIVLENVRGAKLKIVEVGASDSQSYNDVIPLLSTEPQLQLDYHVTDSDLSKLDADELESLEISPTVWNNTDDVPNQITGADLVIFKCDPDNDLTDSIDKVKDAIKESGFILIHNHKGQKSIKCLEDTGFIKIGTRQDDAGSMLLLRKQRDVPPYVIIDVDDLSFRWVDDVRDVMQNSDNTTIWLRVSSDPLSGVVGLVNCLRQEDGGERIR
jgi:fatty acid synthase